METFMGQLINLAEYKFKKLNATLEDAKKCVSEGGIKYWDGKKFRSCDFLLNKDAEDTKHEWKKKEK
ncbi:hypothetical protein LCGC14_2067190 [marine sediment metagenome]|uniref:Uncharacterized protein n=1 Tax=marine sediment metagenome TaxID=412755 RepID=A0A0F9EJJ7_9ZZZZ